MKLDNINEIKLSIGRTINLGNFESLRVDLSISTDVTEGIEDLDAEVAEIELALSRNLESIIGKQTGKSEEYI